MREGWDKGCGMEHVNFFSTVNFIYTGIMYMYIFWNINVHVLVRVH